MYLLLAVGITLGMVFVGGALLGFVSGFVDGFSGMPEGSNNTKSLMAYGTMILILMVCLVLHWVFLRSGFASYTMGRIPDGTWWKIVLPLVLVEVGLALICMRVEQESGGERLMSSITEFIKDSPLQVFVCFIAQEAISAMVIYGAVLRELLEWKHRPQIIIPVALLVVALINWLNVPTPWLIIPIVLAALIEMWTFECTRSFVPILVSGVVFWLVYIFVPESSFSWWGMPLAVVLIVPSTLYLIRVMDRFRPID